jgi:translation initiation factor eIF-2B subunit delta
MSSSTTFSTPQEEPSDNVQEVAAASAKPKKVKAVPAGLVIPPKAAKPTSKAERRALQEAQRAAKAASGSTGKSNEGGKKDSVKANETAIESARLTKDDEANVVLADQTTRESNKKAPEASTLPRTSVPAATVDKPPGLASHLTPYRDPSATFSVDTAAGIRLLPTSSSSVSQHLHAAVLELGHYFATTTVLDDNERCRHMMLCFQLVLQDHDFIWAQVDRALGAADSVDLRLVIQGQILKPSFTYWTSTCRPHSVGLGNAFGFVKSAVSALDRQDSRITKSRPGKITALLTLLGESMEDYVRERIQYAGQAIAVEACTKVLRCGRSVPNRLGSSSDQVGATSQPPTTTAPLYHEVIVTYGYSEAVLAVLREAAQRIAASNQRNGKLKVIVVDAAPHYSGRLLVAVLLQHNQELQHENGDVIECTYVLLNALTYVLDRDHDAVITKVLLGASALYSDGSVLARAGTALVALATTQHKNIPVLVCSETYKIANTSFSGAKQQHHFPVLDSLTQNELGDPATIAGYDQSKAWNAMNLVHDLTPSAMVSGIVTELGIVPPTSVAMLLREMNVVST